MLVIPIDFVNLVCIVLFGLMKSVWNFYLIKLQFQVTQSLFYFENKFNEQF